MNIIETYKKPLIIAGILIVLIGLALLIVQNQKSAKLAQGWNQLYQAKQVVTAELEKMLKAAEEAKAVSKDSKNKANLMDSMGGEQQRIAFKKMDVDAKFGEGVKKLEAVTTAFSGTIVGWEASLELGDLYFDHGQYEKAGNWYQKALPQANSPLNKTLTALALSAALENQGKYDESIQHLEKAVNWGVTYQKGEVLIATARIHALKKDTAKARSVADRIIAELSNTEYSKQAEVIKSQLQ